MRQGDVIRVPEIGPLKAKEGSDLVLVFLGACEKHVAPDVPAYLLGLGFARTHAFEVTLYWLDPALGEESPCSSSRHVFTADSPVDAVSAAARFARAMDAREPELSLAGLSLCLMRLGPIGSAGHPTNGRGNTFARWSVDSGLTLEELEAMATNPPAEPETSATTCDAAGPAE